MTFPAITSHIQSKFKGNEHFTNFTGAVELIKPAQDDRGERRLKGATAKMTLFFMSILAIISICVLIDSALR